MEDASEAVRWVSGQGEPASGQQKIDAVFSNGRQPNARNGAVLLIGQNAAVFKSQFRSLAGGDHIGQGDVYIQSILPATVNLKNSPGGVADVGKAQIWVQFAFDRAGGCLRFKFHDRARRKHLVFRGKRGENLVRDSAESRLLGRLRRYCRGPHRRLYLPERCARRKEQASRERTQLTADIASENSVWSHFSMPRPGTLVSGAICLG